MFHVGLRQLPIGFSCVLLIHSLVSAVDAMLTTDAGPSSVMAARVGAGWGAGSNGR